MNIYKIYYKWLNNKLVTLRGNIKSNNDTIAYYKKEMIRLKQIEMKFKEMVVDRDENEILYNNSNRENEEIREKLNCVLDEKKNLDIKNEELFKNLEEVNYNYINLLPEYQKLEKECNLKR